MKKNKNELKENRTNKLTIKKGIIYFLIMIMTFPILIMDVSATDTARSNIVMDLNSGRVLYEKNAKEKRLIASTTKILTAVVTLENADLKKKVKIGEEILTMYGTNIYIEVGEEITIEELLYGLLLRSGNDSAVALAVAVSKTEEEFVKLMNQKAQEIGMKDSTFANPHGLDEETKNYSTAYDMALLSKYAYQNPTYRKIVKTKKHTVSTGEKTYLWYNRNKLLSSYEYCTGGKNGYTPSAGKTLVTTAKKDNLALTVVTLDDGNEYGTHKDLYENMYEKYQNYTIIDKTNFQIDKEFYEGNAYLKKSFTYPLTEKEIDKIKTVISITKSKTSKVGVVKIYLDEKEIGQVPIYSKTKKEEASFFSKIKSLFTR